MTTKPLTKAQWRKTLIALPNEFNFVEIAPSRSNAKVQHILRPYRTHMSRSFRNAYCSVNLPAYLNTIGTTAHLGGEHMCHDCIRQFTAELATERERPW